MIISSSSFPLLFSVNFYTWAAELINIDSSRVITAHKKLGLIVLIIFKESHEAIK